MQHRYFAMVGGLAALGATVAFAQPVMDGTADASYGAALAVQDNQTGFGDSNLGVPDWANGSEIDGLYGTVVDGVLYVVFAGNVESNWNKIEIFFDSVAGGQNTLRGDNPDVDFNGLNRMGDDGNANGLTFDAGFEADYYLTITGGDNGGVYNIFSNYAMLRTGDDMGIGAYLGMGSAQSDGTLVDGDNFGGIRITIDNSNVLGVDGGEGVSDGSGVETGVEIAIPLAALGFPTDSVKICAFINGGGHDYLANQVLAGLGGAGNLGEPRNVNFNDFAGDQFVTVSVTPGTAFAMATSTLTAGQSVTLTTSNGTANAMHYFAYSLSGLGSTTIGALGITLDLDSPAEAGRSRADGSGSATFSRTVPNAAAGFRIYLQACENGDTTNVIARMVN